MSTRALLYFQGEIVASGSPQGSVLFSLCNSSENISCLMGCFEGLSLSFSLSRSPALPPSIPPTLARSLSLALSRTLSLFPSLLSLSPPFLSLARIRLLENERSVHLFSSARHALASQMWLLETGQSMPADALAKACIQVLFLGATSGHAPRNSMLGIPDAAPRNSTCIHVAPRNSTCMLWPKHAQMRLLETGQSMPADALAKASTHAQMWLLETAPVYRASVEP